MSILNLFLSGGASNSNVNLSLGGLMSSVPINFTSLLDNLFDDVSAEQSLNGLIDFRCLYVKNIDGTQTVHGMVLNISSQVAGGSTIDLGADLINEQQTLTISGTPATDGTANVTLSVPGWGVSFVASYGTDTTTLASSIQSLMSQQPIFFGVTAAAASSSSVLITFAGNAKNHLMPLISVLASDLGNGATINPSKTVEGSPIGVNADPIANDLVTPAVTLGLTSLSIGELRPGEFFPVWLRRTTPAGSLAVLQDNCVLGITGTYP